MEVSQASEKPVVFVFTTAYDPFIGGAEIAIKEVTQRLKDEFRFFIFTSRFRPDLKKFEEGGGVLIRRIGLGFWFDKFIIPFAGFFVVRSYAARYKPVLFWAVMASYASGIPYLINMLRLGKQVPVVLTLQEGDSLEHIKTAKFGLVGLSWKAALSRTHYFTAISKFLLNLGKEFGYMGGASVVPNGVDVSAFTKKHMSDELKILRDELGIKASEKVVITTSRLVEKNAIDVAVRSLGILRRRGVTVKFIVIGSGDKERELKVIAREEGVGDNVIFLGNIPHKDVPKYLKISDVFVRPSRSEGLGNSFIEAMAAGVPIIGTMVGGIVDFLEDGKTGLAVKVNDPADLASKAERLLLDDVLARSIGDGGQRVALVAFQWGDIAQKYGSIFNNVIAKYAKPVVLIATGIFPPDIGGPATYSKLLFDELPACGFDVRVISFGEVRTLPKLIRHFVYLFKLFGRARQSDLIFAQDPVSVGLPAALASKLLGKKYLLKIVGDYAWEQGMQRFGVSDLLDDFLKKRYGMRIWVLRTVQKLSAKSANRIIVPSAYLKNVVISWGITPDKINVVYNAFDKVVDKPMRDSVRSQLGMSGIVAISTGRLVPWKGFFGLIKSVSAIRKNFSDFKLYIIGTGPEEDNLKLEIKKLGLENIVIMVGAVPHSEIKNYFAAADLFVLNTAYEGFSHTILEAMAFGLPVITTSAGGNSEIVQNGINGLLVTYNDFDAMTGALKMLIEDKVLRQRLVEGAEIKVAEFSKDKMLVETSNILRNLL